MVVMRRRLRAIVHVLSLAALAAVPACTDGFLPPGVLAEEPEVLALSVTVAEDGPHAEGLAPLPAGRQRAELLPLDVVELDALVADGEGVLDLDDAAWVLCAGECIPSLDAQGQQGPLPACAGLSPPFPLACLAGRGAYPRATLPAIAPVVVQPFRQVGVIVGGRHGPSTDACLHQLVEGSPVELWGCGIGVRNLTFGPPWALAAVLAEAGIPTPATLPAIVGELLPANAAPRFEEVLVRRSDDPGEEEPEPTAIDETIAVEVGGSVSIEPVVPTADRQIVLEQVGPEQWIGSFETVSYHWWTDHPEVRAGDWFTGTPREITLQMPLEPTELRVYVTAEDERGATSWFVLELEVVDG